MILHSSQIKYWIGHFICLLSNKDFSSIPTYSVIIAAPGGGNIGDQAMLESFLLNVDGKKLVIKTHANELHIPDKYVSNVEVIELTGLIYGSFLLFFWDFLKFKNLMVSIKALYIVGADVMDGGYNKNASAMRSYIAFLSKRYNVPTRVLGFSWNSNPARGAISAIKKADSAGVLFCVRDPISYKRLVEAELKNIRQVSDVVFANGNTEKQGIEDILNYCSSDKKIAIVNASGLISEDINQIKEYSQIIDKLIGLAFSIVLLPHVIRGGADDLPVCQKLAIKYPEVFFVNRLLEPDQVKRIAKDASLVVTGRMHLSIISLNQNTPSIVLSTQGKVDGLMEFFETKNLSVEPKPNFGFVVSDLISDINNDYVGYKQRITSNLDKVRALALENFR